MEEYGIGGESTDDVSVSTEGDSLPASDDFSAADDTAAPSCPAPQAARHSISVAQKNRGSWVMNLHIGVCLTLNTDSCVTAKPYVTRLQERSK